jgi:hypothetical protein
LFIIHEIGTGAAMVVYTLVDKKVTNASRSIVEVLNDERGDDDDEVAISERVFRIEAVTRGGES